MLHCYIVDVTPPGFLQEDHQAEAEVRQVRPQVQDPKEKPQQVPVLPIPQVPVCGHVPQRWAMESQNVTKYQR